jgi:hypothetical protein
MNTSHPLIRHVTSRNQTLFGAMGTSASAACLALCATMPAFVAQARATSTPTPVYGGMRDESPMRPALVAEALIEGASTNADGNVRLGEEAISLSGDVPHDFARVARAAAKEQNIELAVAAALATLCLAPPHEQEDAWRLVATIIEQSDTGLAVALATRRSEIVTWIEHNRRQGLHAGAHLWREACARRCQQLVEQAMARYVRAQGVIDDDETEIERALLELREAHDLMAAHGLSVKASIRIRNAIGLCESDLWSSDVRQANAAYDELVKHGARRLESILHRLGTALEYAQQLPAVTNGLAASRSEEASR